tara:strand:+ start:4761 stop:6167 length:1407 start_codon:yes stop_codon:yes gene_type:complete
MAKRHIGHNLGIEELRPLIIGGGGRERAIAIQLLAPANNKIPMEGVRMVPGNGKATELIENVAIGYDLPGGVDPLLDYIHQTGINLVITGSENDLVEPNSLADRLRNEGIYTVGASSAAARFEGSKIFARENMQAWGVQIPWFEIFRANDYQANAAAALKFAREKFKKDKVNGLVIKADGLCGGKGVYVCKDYDEFARVLIEEMPKHDSSSINFLVEEMLVGKEVSVTVAVANKDQYIIMPYTADHKPVGEGDTGPNGGGMGAITVTLPMAERNYIKNKIVDPQIKGAAKMGSPLNGSILYVGLMLTDDGRICVLEDNLRFGDPEAQVALPRISSDFGALMLGVAAKNLTNVTYSTNSTHWGVVDVCADNYPGDTSHVKGHVLQGVDEAAKQAEMLVSGCKFEGGIWKINGTRFMNYRGSGKSAEEAVKCPTQAARTLVEANPGKCFARYDIGKDRDVSNFVLNQGFK